MTVAWFGPEPFAPLCEYYPRVKIPVGELCLWCDERIGESDTGVMMPAFTAAEGMTVRAVHSECEMRASVGGYNHLKGNCTCCGGKEPPDPPGWSKRETALLACVEWRRQRALKRES